MADTTLRDWREDAGVLAARAAHEAAAVEVGRLEGEHVKALRAVRQAEAELADMEATLGKVSGERASVNDVARARAAVASLRHEAEQVEEQALGAFEALAAAEAALTDVSARMQAECWPAFVASYRRAALRLDECLRSAVDAEEVVEQLHRAGVEQFGSGSGGWLKAPGSGEHIGNAAFGDRRLRRVAVDGWRKWVTECGVFEGRGAQKLVALAAGLRALAAGA